METLQYFTNLLLQKKELANDQIKICTQHLVSEKVNDTLKENFLSALSLKEESPLEIASFVKSFRKLSRNPNLDQFSNNAIDLCGTGGDKAGSFNISTFVSFVIASSGVSVIKHGNRSVSSKCGSADLIEAIGIPLEQDNASIMEAMKKLNFAFLFAPSFHPAFKHVAPVRRTMAKKGLISIFNILGPMINPANPSFQILGVYSKKLVSKVKESLQHTGVKGGFVLHGIIDNDKDISGVDELTSCGPNMIAELGQNASKFNRNLIPKDFGLPQSPITDLKGGNLSENLKLMNLVLEGNAPKGLTNSILMNCSLAFLSVNKTSSLEEGVELAEKLVIDGTVKSWLDDARKHFS